MRPMLRGSFPALLLAGLLLALPGRSSAAPGALDPELPLVRLVAAGGVDPSAPLGEAVRLVMREQGFNSFPKGPRPPSSSGKERGITINTSHVEYETATRHYEQDDAAGLDPLIASVVTDQAGLDGAILVVPVPAGVSAVVEGALAALRRLGARSLLVFLDAGGAAATPPDFERIEKEVAELLARYEFPGDKTPIIRGSALGAIRGDPAATKSILGLVEALDRYVPLPPRDKDKPFLMPVEDVLRIGGRGTVATGRIETGVIRPGDSVEIVGLGAPTVVTEVTGLERIRKILDRGEAGDDMGLLLGDLDGTSVRRGQVMASPGTVRPHATFRALVYVKEKPGRHTPFHNKYRPSFRIRTADVTGEITLEDGRSVLDPGATGEVTVDLIVPVAMDKGLRFAIREGGRTVGAGQVTEIVK